MLLNYKILFFSVIVLSLFSCNTDDQNMEASLPPKTQTGEQTLGFKVGDEIFAKNSPEKKPPRISYQEINGNYFLTIGADFIKNNEPKTMQIVGQGIDPLEEKSYVLEERVESKIWAGFYEGSSEDPYSYFTTDVINGTLNISYLDEKNSIISGEFEFTALNEDGTKIVIREGRFDLKYFN